MIYLPIILAWRLMWTYSPTLPKNRMNNYFYPLLIFVFLLKTWSFVAMVFLALFNGGVTLNP